MKGGAGIYLITRIHGLRTHLISPADIQLLAKAKNLRDVTDNLLKTDYASEIGKIPTAEQDATTLEGIFLRRLVERFYFVQRAAQGRTQELLSRYCARFEVENIKRILRAKQGQSTEEPTLIPIPREYSLVNFPALVKSKDMDELASLLRDTPYHSLLEKTQQVKERGASMILEAALDRIYFGRVWDLARRSKGVRELIGEEMDLRNLMIAFSLKTRGMSLLDMEESLIPLSYRLPQSQLRSLLQSRIEDASGILAGRYSRLAAEASDILRSDSSSPLEWLFFRQLYGDAYTALRAHALEPGYIMAYLLLCECEAKNLISIVTGMQLNLSEEEILRGLSGV
jgi:vacuolar-type H+-ATPase subunit C/Vma6